MLDAASLSSSTAIAQGGAMKKVWACEGCGAEWKFKVHPLRKFCVACRARRDADYQRCTRSLPERKAKADMRRRLKGILTRDDEFARRKERANALMPKISALRERGFNYDEIAKRMGLTRGTVIGIAWRAAKNATASPKAIGEGVDTPSRQPLQLEEAT